MDGRTPRQWWGTAIESSDPQALAAFYSRLLGWPIIEEGPQVAVLRPPQEGIFLVFQLAEDYVAPRWPTVPSEQRPMMHFDFEVEHLERAVNDAVSMGARLADVQPKENVRVMFDPDGHPFCLCLDDGT
jgi:catechol 2,3-dioxygenase-like lactoylglutathione lyase family enzyme